MNFPTAVKTCFQKYFTFSGRASRSEYWWFNLFYLLIAGSFFALAEFENVDGIIPIIALFLIFGFIIPLYAVAVRWLHDIDKSGWFILIQMIPVVGGLILLYWSCCPGTQGDNKYGSDPIGLVNLNYR